MIQRIDIAEAVFEFLIEAGGMYCHRGCGNLAVINGPNGQECNAAIYGDCAAMSPAEKRETRQRYIQACIDLGYAPRHRGE